MAQLYMIQNTTGTTTAAPVKQPTGTAIRTMLQVALSSTFPAARIVEWGCSFDGSAAATPGEIELVETGSIFATLDTALAAGDIIPWNDPNAPANTAGTSGVPFNLGTSLSCFNHSSATTEGSITTTREFDSQLVAPTNQYIKQFPLGREPELNPGKCLRVRATFGTTVNMYCYVIIEV